MAIYDAFATKKKKGGNVAEQSISQSQSSVQNAFLLIEVKQHSYHAITLAYKTKKTAATTVYHRANRSKQITIFFYFSFGLI